MTSSGALVPRPRKDNEELVLRLLHRHGPMTRARLIALSGLSRTTLYDSVTALVDDGTLTVTVPEMARRKRGRPVERLALNPVAGAIGIDFAQHSIRVATANVAYKITGMATRPHDLKAPWKERVEMAYHLAGTLTDGTMPPGAIGIGVSGPMAGPAGSWDDGNHGTVSMLVRERFGIPARLDNNARLAAFAEATWGAAVSERDVLYVQLSHTVSGGLVLGGTLHRGVGGLAGEFGHISLDPVGLSCGCGARGCLETTASIGAVLRSYRTAGGAAENLTQLATALRAGDRRARGVLAEAGAQVGRALAAASNIIGPGVIVVGGEVAALGPAVMEPVRRELHANVVAGLRARIRLCPAKLGDASAALGAIAMSLHRLPRPSSPVALFPATSPRPTAAGRGSNRSRPSTSTGNLPAGVLAPRSAGRPNWN
jgi:predicted NBD/HSP70 family sugar kinase